MRELAKFHLHLASLLPPAPPLDAAPAAASAAPAASASAAPLSSKSSGGAVGRAGPQPRVAELGSCVGALAAAVLKVQPLMAQLYSCYCNGYDRAAQLLAERRGSSPKLAAFLERQRRAQPQGRQHALEALLIQPVQRLCRYPLLLTELAKHLPRSLARPVAAVAAPRPRASSGLAQTWPHRISSGFHSRFGLKRSLVRGPTPCPRSRPPCTI